jgi:Tfp pilus assembly protein PilF
MDQSRSSSCRTKVSTTDTRQKAKSFLKLADLYFDDKKYPDAQQYYDSTIHRTGRGPPPLRWR